jgi:signal transduction histidine kinase
VNPALSFGKRVIAQQAILTVLGFAALAAFVPPVLRLEDSLVGEVAIRVTAIGLLAAATVGAAVGVRLGRLRFTLRALALGSRAVETHEVDALSRVPQRALRVKWAVELVALGAVVLALPRDLGASVAQELLLLGAMMTLATSVPAHVLAQSSVARLLEAAPLEVVTAHLDDLALRGEPRRVSRRNLTFAVVVPIALVGVGGGLASFAHLRALTDQGRIETATILGRSVVAAGETRDHVGQLAAIEAARKAGYSIAFTDEERLERLRRTDEGEHVLAIPLERGSVTVAFTTALGFRGALPLAAVALGFSLLGLVAARSVARLLSRDLSRAAGRLRALGTDEVLKGRGDGPIEARFVVVGELARAALALAERFRVFAAAQERALEARATALRMRGLFFASVSHDLKSPLNAILGFADSIDRSALTPSQTESLDLIATRGRELVALIETILDAARVEAGQLKLARQTTPVSHWLAHAARLARELSQESGELTVEAGEGLPTTEVDRVMLSRALAVVIAHALRAPTQDGAPARVTVRASVPARERRIRIEVDHGNTAITAVELAALFARQSSSRGRGLTLGLSLARSVFELHGGSIEVHGEPTAPPVVLAFVPVAASVAPPPRPKRA